MTNSENHNICPRQSKNRHLPQANLTIYEQGVHFSGIKCFNKLPLEIKKNAGNLNKFSPLHPNGKTLSQYLNTP